MCGEIEAVDDESVERVWKGSSRWREREGARVGSNREGDRRRQRQKRALSLSGRGGGGGGGGGWRRTGQHRLRGSQVTTLNKLSGDPCAGLDDGATSASLSAIRLDGQRLGPSSSLVGCGEEEQGRAEQQGRAAGQRRRVIWGSNDSFLPSSTKASKGSRQGVAKDDDVQREAPGSGSSRTENSNSSSRARRDGALARRTSERSTGRCPSPCACTPSTSRCGEHRERAIATSSSSRLLFREARRRFM